MDYNPQHVASTLKLCKELSPDTDVADAFERLVADMRDEHRSSENIVETLIENIHTGLVEDIWPE